MAEIKTMYRTLSQSDVWVPSEMTSTSEIRPKIAGFAHDHDPAKLYANLLLQYTNRRQNLSGTLETETAHENNIKCQWFESKTQAGYFCKHGDFVSFVAEKKDIINNFQELKKILDSFKAKYQKTDWTFPVAAAAAVPQQEPDEQRLKKLVAETEQEGRQNSWTREQRLQKIADTLKEEKTLTVAALLRADQRLYDSIKPCDRDPLLGGQAVPHIHPYNNEFYSKAFSLKGNIFVTFDKSFNENKEEFMLFRPHNWYLYCEGINRQKYEETYRKNVHLPPITSTIVYLDDIQPMEFKTSSFSVHEGEHAASKEQVTILSWKEPVITSFRVLLKKKFLFSEITDPVKYKAKTLHIILDAEPPVPDDPEQLIEYFEKLPLPPEQQKRLIQGLFPFIKL